MNRRLFFGATASTAVALGAGYSILGEPRWLEVCRTTVHLRRTNSSAQPVRILQLTDMHASPAVPMSLIEKAAELGLAEKPDLICLTGDFVTKDAPYNASHYTDILTRLSQAVPTYAVLGNHDGGSWGTAAAHGTPIEQMLDRARISLLHNRAESMQIKGQRFTLAGVGDLWTRQVNGHAAFESVTHDDPVILLAHNPDTKDSVDEYSWHLMLSGHTHGGQVVLPLAGALFAPVRDKRYVAGLHAWGDDRQIYTSRGVGNLHGVRIRCRPEVTILDVVVA